MVFFNCNACGESVKKNQVEKHYQFQCRNCEVLSCVDCGKEFWGEAYKEHNKCISEEEKYSGKNYKPKPGANKGEAKQEQWLQLVHAAIEKAPKNNSQLKNLLQQLEDYPNIPRKRAKFENFLKNSLRVWDKSLAGQVWDMLGLDKVKQESQQQVQEAAAPKSENKSEASTEVTPGDGESNQGKEHKLSKRERKEERRKKAGKLEKKDRKINQQEDEENEGVNKKKKGKKRKHRDEEEEDDSMSNVKDEVTNGETKSKKKKKREKEGEESPDTENTGESENPNDAIQESPRKGKFNWEAIIVQLLKKADGAELPIKRLRKKVLAEYSTYGGNGKTEEKLLSKFNKKISTNPRFRVHKERVKLKQ